MFCVSSVVSRVPLVSLGQLQVLKRLVHSSVVINVRCKDVVPVTKESAGSQDILLQNVRSATDSSDVLNAIYRHHTIMNSKHVVQAIRSIFTLQKVQSSRMSNGEIINSKDFRKLCEVLKSQIRHLELNELIEMLKCLGYLGVKADSKIVTLILNLITKQVNDLSLQQITFLDFIMKDFKVTPLVKALKIALPIVFEANMKTKCNFDNVAQLSELLIFVAKRKHMNKSVDMLVEALTERRNLLAFKDAKNIVYALCDFSFQNEDSRLLLCHVLDIITDSLNTMDFFEMDSIFGRLNSKYIDNENDPTYYHEEFCNGCCKMMMGNNYSFEQNVWVLKKLIKFNHAHLGFLDHIAAKIEQEPWQLEQCGASGFITVLSGFSLADYKPPNWDRIKNLFIKTCQTHMTDRPELFWMRVVLDLCVMGCWDEDLVKQMFTRQYLESIFSRGESKLLDHIQLLMLDQVAATISPWPVKPRAPGDFVDPIVQVYGSHITTFPLQAALQQGLGGQEYVHTGVHTSLGHFLDHVVVMRKGSYPVAINPGGPGSTDRITTDDIHVPADSTIVAVLFVPSSMCAVNNERVRGVFRVQINSVEALGVAVAPILEPVWTTLPEFERIPYLMRAIQTKLPATETTNVVTPV